MSVDNGCTFRLFIILSTLPQTISEFAKEVPFPKHVDKVEHSLIWAVKVKDVLKPVDSGIIADISSQNGFSRNQDKTLQFSHDTENLHSDIHFAQKIADDCVLVHMHSIDALQDTYLLGFDIDKIHRFDSSFNNVSSILKLDGRNLHVKLLHHHYTAHVPRSSFQLIQDSLSRCLNAHPMVEWFSQQNVRKRTKRTLHLQFSDPFFKLQWHLVSIL